MMRRVFLRWLVGWMENHYNKVPLPDGTWLVRMSTEFHGFVYSEGWRTFSDRTGKSRGASLQ